MSGRGLAIGYAALMDNEPSTLFDGSPYGPENLTAEEVLRFKNKELAQDIHVRFDFQEWLVPYLERALETGFEPVMELLKSRAGVHLRVNSRKGNREEAVSALEGDTITSEPHMLVETALEVTSNPRKVNNSRAFQEGLVDLQDAASQAVCSALPLSDGMRVLDYCAGGGGKSLAMAERCDVNLFAHDIDQNRMSDLPDRAKRLGVNVETLRSSQLNSHAPYDLVVCDVPCSGSGAWRRAPDGKWKLTLEMLDKLLITQQEILSEAVHLVAPGGSLAYVTCSLLMDENEDQIARFLSGNTGWMKSFSRRYSPLEGGDGFFLCCLTREK